jgi:NAD dependent epimerase/dehydratase
MKKSKKIFVTGADGFIGSHLVEKLIDENHDVTAMCYYNSFNNYGWLDTIDKKKIKNAKIVLGDVRDENLINKISKDTEIFYHLAALIGIPYSYTAVDSYIDTNIKGTKNILSSCLNNKKIEKIIITSTSEVYGSAINVPINETHPLQAQSPYSASKIAADSLATSFQLSFGLPITIARPFNNYGPRQSARAVIPTIISQILNGRKKIELGNINTKRDFIYVKDTVDALSLLKKDNKMTGEVVNICSANEISIENLFNKIKKLLKSNAKLVTKKNRIRPKNSEVTRLLGDNKKMIKSFKWKAKYNLEDGLKETIEWYSNEKNLSFFKKLNYTI